MKKLLLFVLIIFSSNLIFGQTNLFENPNFDEIAKNHKIIGVIPFKASIALRPREMKQITPELLKKSKKRKENQSNLHCIRGF